MHVVARGAQQRRDAVPAPAAVPGAVDEQEGRHARAPVVAAASALAIRSKEAAAADAGDVGADRRLDHARVGGDHELLDLQRVDVFLHHTELLAELELGELRVVDLVVPGEREEVVRLAPGRRGHPVDDLHVEPFGLLGAGRRDPDVEDEDAGRVEVAVLPAVDVGGDPHRGAVEGRRLDADHVPDEGDGVALADDVDRGRRDRGVADRARVQERLVRQVEQVLHEQHLAGLERDDPVHVRPARVGEPGGVRDRLRVGEVRVTGPDPDDAVPLHDREPVHGGLGEVGLLGDADAEPRAVDPVAVVVTGDHVVVEDAQRERVPPVRAAVLDRVDAAVGEPVEADRPTTDPPLHQRPADLVGPGADVPAVHDDGVGRHGSPQRFSAGAPSAGSST